MRALLYNTQGLPREVLQLCDTVSEPEATKRTPIIVDIHAIALNPDSSVLMRIIPTFFLRRAARIPEIDFSGVISEVGQLPASCSLKVGDKVYGQIPPVEHVSRNIGTLAEKVAVSPSWIIPKPAGLTYEEAAALPTSFISAYKLTVNIHNGSRVFVNGGSGGVGLALLQILKHWKQATVTTTASEQSWNIVKKYGPDNIINYREVQELSSHLKEKFEPFDYAIDLVGDVALLKQSSRFLAKDGTFVAFGGGLSSASLLSFLAWLIKTTATGLLPRWLGGSGRGFRLVTVSREQDTIEGLRLLGDFREKGWVQPCIDSMYDFDAALEGYERLAT